VDRILFAPPMVGCGNFSRNQAVSIAGGEINEWDWSIGIPEPSTFLLAALGLPALLALRRRRR
jgi:hypothetical protein